MNVKKWLAYVQSSFDTHSQGASARKMTAWWFTMLLTIVHIAWLQHAVRNSSFNYLLEILVTDFGFIATCLGMTTYETNQKMKLNTKETLTAKSNSVTLEKETPDVDVPK